jgi:hypothetical protein
MILLLRLHFLEEHDEFGTINDDAAAAGDGFTHGRSSMSRLESTRSLLGGDAGDIASKKADVGILYISSIAALRTSASISWSLPLSLSYSCAWYMDAKDTLGTSGTSFAALRLASFFARRVAAFPSFFFR